MKYKEERRRITVEPTNDVEIAYIEEVLGLRKAGDKCELVRVNAMSLGCIAYLETHVIDRSPRAEQWLPRTIAECLDNSAMPDSPAKCIETFAYKMHGDFARVNTYELDERRAFYEGEIQTALKSGNYVRVANLAMLLDQPD